MHARAARKAVRGLGDVTGSTLAATPSAAIQGASQGRHGPFQRRAPAPPPVKPRSLSGRGPVRGAERPRHAAADEERKAQRHATPRASRPPHRRRAPLGGRRATQPGRGGLRPGLDRPLPGGLGRLPSARRWPMHDGAGVQSQQAQVCVSLPFPAAVGSAGQLGPRGVVPPALQRQRAHLREQRPLLLPAQPLRQPQHRLQQPLLSFSSPCGGGDHEVVEGVLRCHDIGECRR